MTDRDKLEFENEEVWQEDQEERGNWLRRNLIPIFLIFFAFLLGLSIMGWQYWKASGETLKTKSELIETNRSFQREKIKTLIMSAVIEANKGDHDLALVDTSRFFTSLRSEIDNNDNSVYFVDERARLKGVFQYRDLTIASIARRESTAADKLLVIYSYYLRSIGESRKGTVKENNKIETQSNTNSNMNTENPASTIVEGQKTAANTEAANSEVGNQNNLGANVQNANNGEANTN